MNRTDTLLRLKRFRVDEMKRRGKAVSSVEIAGVGHTPTFIDEAQIRIAENFFNGATV